MRSRHLWILRITTVVAFAAVLFAACGGDDGGGAGAEDEGGSSISLSAVDNSFEPAELEVPSSGQVTVEFTNDGDNPHTFTSDEGGFDSGTVEGGQSKTVTFEAPDKEISFLCTVHGESMSGTIVPEG